jgi:hypothetical protein
VIPAEPNSSKNQVAVASYFLEKAPDYDDLSLSLIKRRLTMRSIIRWLQISCLLLILLFGVSACGSGGGDAGGTEGDGGTPATANVAGEWGIHESVDNTACSEPNETKDYSVTVQQNGNSIMVTTPIGSFNGTVNGNVISWTGQYFDSTIPGYITITSMSLTVNGNTLSGTAHWDFRNTATGPVVCSGTTQITGTLAPTATVPNAPSGLSATGPSQSSIQLQWTNQSGDEEGFKIERSLSSGAGFTQITTVGPGTVSFTDTGLNASTTYYYEVRAYNSVGDSAYSNVANATTLPPPTTIPPAPTNLGALATSSSSIQLSWTHTGTNESGFKVGRGIASGGPFTQIATPGANILTYTDTGLNASTTYYYEVRAYNSVGDSAYSNVASAIAPCISTAPVLSGQSGTNSVTLTWTYNWGGGLASTADGYELQESPPTESPTSPPTGFVSIFSTVNQNDHQSPKTYTTGTRSAGTYYYRVRAFKLSAYTPWSSVVPVVVAASTTPLLRIIDDLSDKTAGTNLWGQWNTIIRVRIGSTETAVRVNNNTLEKLWPSDSASGSSTEQLNYVIVPKYNQLTSYRDFDVSGFSGGNYWVYIQNGWWEFFNIGGGSSWEKHMTTVVGCDGVSTVFKWTIVKVTGHTSGTLPVKASSFLPQGNWYGSLFCQ